jgi:hypothetical protein
VHLQEKSCDRKVECKLAAAPNVQQGQLLQDVMSQRIVRNDLNKVLGFLGELYFCANLPACLGYGGARATTKTIRVIESAQLPEDNKDA